MRLLAARQSTLTIASDCVDRIEFLQAARRGGPIARYMRSCGGGLTHSLRCNMMRTTLLAFVLAGTTSLMVLAQVAPSARAADAPGTDGPLLGPPVINIPEGIAGPMPPPATPPETKKSPRLFRLPKPTGDAATPPSGKRFTSRWKSRTLAPPAPAPVATPDLMVEAPPLPEATDSAPKKSLKKGPIEFFPKTKASDRTANPLPIRRPIMAW
jgi:hypothetical protein